jgi:PAS domain-containing protein
MEELEVIQMSPKPTYEELQQKINELEKEAVQRKQIENALRKTEERLSQITEDFCSVPTFIINENLFITHWNRSCENITGISANEVVGTRKQWKAFYSEERPVMADLIVNEASEEEMARFYGDKCQKSALIEGAYEAEDFFPIWVKAADGFSLPQTL